MTGRIKTARKQRELDALAFNVLHRGALQWTDWHETTRARRGKVGLGTTTFANSVKRLTAEGRVRVDGDGWYGVNFYDTGLEPEPTPLGRISRSSDTNESLRDALTAAKQQLKGGKSSAA